MADNADLTIKVRVETDQAKRDIKSTQKELKGLQEQSAKASRVFRYGITGQKAAKAFSAARTGLGVAAAARAVAGVGIGNIRRAATTASRLPIGPILLGMAAIVTALKVTSGYMRKSSQDADRQSKTMASLLIESRKTNRSIGLIQGSQLAAADPFMRSAEFFRRRQEAQGFTPTAREASALASLEVAKLENTIAKAANERFRGSQAAPFKQLALDIGSLLEVAKLQAGRAVAGEGQGVGGSVSSSAALSAFGPIGILASLFTRGGSALSSLQGQGRQADMLANLRGGDRRNRAIQLAELQRRGPGATLTPAPTVRAGTRAEYAFQVAQQARATHREATIQWQREVLAALRLMVQRGEIPPDKLVATQISLGVPVTGVP